MKLRHNRLTKPKPLFVSRQIGKWGISPKRKRGAIMMIRSAFFVSRDDQLMRVDRCR